MITIGVFAKQKILKEALCSMLESNDEFSAVAVTSDISDLAEEIKESQFNILLFNMYSPNFEEMRFLSQINSSCPRTRILVMSQSNDEELILKTIKIIFMPEESTEGIKEGYITPLQKGEDENNEEGHEDNGNIQ